MNGYVAIWLLGVIPAALIIYPFIKREPIESAHLAASFVAFFWPIFLGMFLCWLPFAALGALVRYVYDD